MSLEDMPWRYCHHQSSFLPHFHMVEDKLASTISSDINPNPQSLILMREVEYEDNLCKITKTMLVDISVKPGTP